MTIQREWSGLWNGNGNGNGSGAGTRGYKEIVAVKGIPLNPRAHRSVV